MRDWAEYEFILPDGSCQYEMIDLTVPARPQIWSFQRMHKAVIVWPVERSRKEVAYREKRIQQLKRARAASLPAYSAPTHSNSIV
jgi:hypothetical protein